MKWDIFFAVCFVIGLIVKYEWPKMKTSPKRDKITFIILLSTAGLLSLFDLPAMRGPITLFKAIFKPFGDFMET